MTVQLTPEQEQRLQHLAAAMTVTPDELAQAGLDRFLDYQEDVMLAVKRGREDIAAGRVVDHDEVFARIERMLDGR
jgi:predicted transcriptional regulator